MFVAEEKGKRVLRLPDGDGEDVVPEITDEILELLPELRETLEIKFVEKLFLEEVGEELLDFDLLMLENALLEFKKVITNVCVLPEQIDDLHLSPFDFQNFFGLFENEGEELLLVRILEVSLQYHLLQLFLRDVHLELHLF